MPGLPLLFTGTGGTTELIHKPLPGLYLGEDTFLGEGIWLDQGVAEAFAKQPFLEHEGIVFPVTTTPAEATMAMPGLPTFGEIVEIVDTVPAVATMAMPQFGGQDLVYPVTTTPAIATMPMPGTSGAIQVILIPSVREFPPLRVYIDVQTPAGKHFRWGADEPDPANVPAGIRFSDTMPGGFETFDCTLPRKSSRAGADLEPFSTIKALSAGGGTVWEGRLERSPRSSGDEVSVSPSAVGYQAALDDDKSAREIYIDIDLSHWGSWAAQRQIDMNTVGYHAGQGSIDVLPDVGPNGLPAISQRFERLATTAGTGPFAVHESWYDSHGIPIGLLYFSTAQFGIGVVDWVVAAKMFQDARGATPGAADSGDLSGSPGPRYLSTSQSHLFALLQTAYGGTFTGDGEWRTDWRNVAVYGSHQLQGRGSDPQGFRASDIVTHAVRRWAPQLNVSSTSVQASGYVIPHLVFLERTTASEMVKQASRFGLQDWAVWDDKTFYWHDRGVNSRHWRTRVGPAQLEETGPQIDRLWESVIVQYQDVDGSTKTVGPPGSGSDFEEADLKDLDPDNPANKAGITRRALLTMGTAGVDPFTQKPGAPIQIGRRFLEEQKLLDSSGRARIIGHVESDRGVVFPYHAVRAGDTLSFVDASDPSPRRIVRTEKDQSSRTCSVDLDAPPEALQALLERLGVGITDLGFN